MSYKDSNKSVGKVTIKEIDDSFERKRFIKESCIYLINACKMLRIIVIDIWLKTSRKHHKTHAIINKNKKHLGIVKIV